MRTLSARLALVASLASLGIVGLPGAARATVTQPNGTVVPVNNGTSLSGYLNGSANNDNINEGINVVTDAASEPQVFSPLCDFAGKYVAKGGGANFAIGWYNVDDARPSNNPPKYVPVDTGANLNTAAAASDIQILFPFSSSLPPAGMRDLTAASIRDNPAYKGGLIGFVLVPNPNGTGNANATQYHYTEHRFNVQCTVCATPGPWYSHLVYKSNQLASTIYLGFEDLDFKNLAGSQGVNGNDLDYEDFVFRFTGVVCAGAGQACEVPGASGLCARGVTDCNGQGGLTCKGVVQPGAQAEQCDAVDNDCDGTIDEGNPCPAGKVCDRGTCVDPCGNVEFPCATGFVCQAGLCVEEACADKTCDPGQVCHGGECRAACEGVVCPPGQICSGDRCIDPCAGVTCDAGQVCVGGVCIASCECRQCGGGESCQAATGACVEAACVDKTCAPGTSCRAGACVPLCDGVTCPPGEMCEAGACVPIPDPCANGACPPDAGPVDAAVDEADAAIGGPGDDGGTGGAGDGDGGGCGCRVGGGERAPWAGLGVALALALVLVARRRRRG
jgi:MYXO-CTERM domain-containing protein